MEFCKIFLFNITNQYKYLESTFYCLCHMDSQLNASFTVLDLLFGLKCWYLLHCPLSKEKKKQWSDWEKSKNEMFLHFKWQKFLQLLSGSFGPDSISDRGKYMWEINLYLAGAFSSKKIDKTVLKGMERTDSLSDFWMFCVKLSFWKTLIFSWLRIKQSPNFPPLAINHSATALIYWREF